MLTRRNILDLASLNGTFDDSLLEIKQNRVFYEQSINLNFIDCLSGAVDSSIKNYSSVYLTNHLLDDDIFKVSDARLNPPVIFTQINVKPIYFDSFPLDLYFQFDVEPQFLLNIDGIHSCSFIRKENIVDIENTIFEFELLPENLCRIKHQYNGYQYFLVYENDGAGSISSQLTACSSNPINFYFKGGPNNLFDPYEVAYNEIITDNDSGLLYSANENVFNYIINGNEIVLYKATETTINTSTPFGSGGGVVTISGPTIPSISLTPVLSNQPIDYSDNNILFVVDTRIEPKLKLNTSWVSYTQNNVTESVIDESNSRFDLPNQNLVTFEYNNTNKDIKFDVLKLKNNLSDKNYTKRQSYMYGITRPNNQYTDAQIITSAPVEYTVFETEDITLSDSAPCYYDLDSISLLTEDLSSIAP